MEDRFGYGAIVRAMRPEEREEMLGLLLEAPAGEMPAGAEEEPPEACPRCGCPRTVRRGRDADGAQRRLCRGCGRSFRASTGRVLGATKLPAATWARYAEAMLAGATLRDAAACGVALKTGFSMRHRLCEVMASMLPAFEAGPGCPVEADETLVPDSLSGNHSRSAGFPCPAPARRCGGDGAATGVSSDKVSVLTMVNARGDAMAVAACRGKMGVADARRAPRSTASTPCTPRSRRSSPASGACPPGAFPTTSRGSAGRARRAGAGTPPRCCGRRWGRGHTGRAGAGSGGSRTRSTRRFPCHGRVNTAIHETI